MASTNQSPFYKVAEANFLKATTNEEKISCLDVMIKECPKHKSAENMLRNLTLRRKKLINIAEKAKKSRKGKKPTIKKTEMQALLLGESNTGKSSIFKTLTNLNPKITPHAYTTYEPGAGSLDYEDVKIQIIDMPAFPNSDKGLINNTDTILLVIDNLEQLKKSESYLSKTRAKVIILFNKIDLLNEQEKRKLAATLTSRKKDFVLFSAETKENIDELKKKLFDSFPIIRIYTKEPRKPVSEKPMILKKGSTVKDVAEKILHGYSSKIKKVKIWGPSSKFLGQVVGIEHILKDKDAIELQTT